MRSETHKAKLEAFMEEFGRSVRGPGCVYLTGGATAVLYGWRSMTIDIDRTPVDPVSGGQRRPVQSGSPPNVRRLLPP